MEIIIKYNDGEITKYFTMCYHFLHVVVNTSVNRSFVHLLSAIELRIRYLRYFKVKAAKEYF